MQRLVAAPFFCNRVAIGDNWIGPESCESLDWVMKNIDNQRLASELLSPAHRAGRRIMSHYGQVDVELKDDDSPVTAADR